jgi:hypothetical protein
MFLSVMAAFWGAEASAGNFSTENPTATRYLYTTSAIPFSRGEGYISQKRGFMTSAAFGLVFGCRTGNREGCFS